MPDAASPSLSILPGRADAFRAEIVVRVAIPADTARGGGDAAGPGRLSGTITGPRRGRDTTLPTTVPLLDVRTGRPPDGPATASARAVFTEPSYWTPELPNLYRLEARLDADARPPVVIDRLIGLRRLGVRGRSFWLDGRRWVPRGVTVAGDERHVAALRGMSAAAVVGDPVEAVCAAADTAGVAVVAWFGGPGGGDRPADDSAVERAAARIATWSLHPAVMLVVVPALPDETATAVMAAARSLKGTMLVGLEVAGRCPPSAAAAADAADFLVLTLPAGQVPHEDWRAARHDRPLVAVREAAVETSAACRAECDRLQADLAAWGLAGGAPPWDWAGYCIRGGRASASAAAGGW